MAAKFSMCFFFLVCELMDRHNQHVTVRADAERRPPQGKPARYIHMRVGPFAIAMALLVHVVHQKTEGSHVSAVGVSAALDVYA